MSFTSMIFLFLFLPVSLILYYSFGKWFKDYLLLALSLLFYAAGSVKYALLFVLVILFIIVTGRIISAVKSTGLKRAMLIAGTSVCIMMLLYYKYFDFGIRTYNSIFGKTIPTLDLALPLGISFFSFKAISYLADIYTGKIELHPDPVHDALYLSFFTQITSGPLSRYNDMVFPPGLEGEKGANLTLFSDGVYRFMIGFNKKVLLANTLANITAEVFSASASDLSCAYAWLGSICYSLELYYDFAGYSDMAIGLSEMFGYKCMENFNYPYMTESAAGFWRRWHISLSQWFRDYVYIPLGGSRNKNPGRVYFNLLVVWLLTGIWHGANWTFIAWGLGFFLMISFERLTGLPKKIKSKPGKAIYRIFTLIFINCEWILFRSDSIHDGFAFIARLVSTNSNPLADQRVLFLIKDYSVFIAAGLLLCAPVVPAIEKRLSTNSAARAVFDTIKVVLVMLLFVWSISFVVAGQNNPFAYANF